MSDAKLNGKVAVITGGNSGIGRSIAESLAAEGVKVAIFGRNAETLESARAAIGGDTLAVQGDVTKVADIERLYAEVAERFGKVDVLIANAGGGTLTPFEEVDEAAFDRQSDTNFKGVFFTIQKALPHLNDGASIQLVSSIAGVKGIPGFAAYSATKAAVRSLARTLAAELAPRGIRVNSISPGPIETPIFDRMGLPAEEINGAKENFASLVPLGRFGKPEEVAAVAKFLAADGSGYVNGVDLSVDGGMAQV